MRKFHYTTKIFWVQIYKNLRKPQKISEKKKHTNIIFWLGYFELVAFPAHNKQ